MTDTTPIKINVIVTAKIDEPTGNLDPDTSQEIIELLERINDVRQTTVLVVTHDREIVQRNKKRTILIEDGCVTTDTSLGGYQDLGYLLVHPQLIL